jgi:hypothetical protein
MEGSHQDQAGGCRWHDKSREAKASLAELSQDELEAELTIAAYAPGRVRFDRFRQLLDERRRRLLAA